MKNLLYLFVECINKAISQTLEEIAHEILVDKCKSYGVDIDKVESIEPDEEARQKIIDKLSSFGATFDKMLEIEKELLNQKSIKYFEELQND